MADLTDVGAALVALAATAVYPSGTGQASVTNAGVRLFQGWPDPQALDADLATGKCQVSVFPRPGGRNISRFPTDAQLLTVNTPTLTATISGQTVTIGGTVPASNNPTNIAIEANRLVWVYAVQPGDTLTSIATALATLIAVGVPSTTNTGPVITFPATARITAARVGVTATMVRELRRQQVQYMLTVWADTPAHRSTLASAIDVLLAKTPFLVMPDTLGARVTYADSIEIDASQKERVYRRDLCYVVEYATTEVITATQVTQQVLNVTPVNGATASLIS
jgi:hypothetical protein